MCENCIELQTQLDEMHNLIIRLFEEQMTDCEERLNECEEKFMLLTNAKRKHDNARKVNKILRYYFNDNQNNEFLQED